MLNKKNLAIAVLFLLSASGVRADIRNVNEAATVKAIGSPVLDKIQEEDSPGCDATRYKFGDDTFDMKLEFKCNRINVGWTVSTEPGNETRSEQASRLAQRAVAILSGENGVEVKRVLEGAKYDGRTYPNGLSVKGGCSMNFCLLTFK